MTKNDQPLAPSASPSPADIAVLHQRIAELEAQVAACNADEVPFSTALFAAVTDAILIVDDATLRILDVNDAAVALYGYSREQLLRLTPVDLSAEPERTRTALQERHESALRRFHRKADGAVFPVDITARFFEWGGRMVQGVVIHDVSEREAMEAALRRSEARFRQLVESNPGVVYREGTDPARENLYVSPQIFDLLALPRHLSTTAGLSWRDYIHAGDRDRVLAWKLSLRETTTPQVCEYRLLRSDGRVVWVRDHAIHVEDPVIGHPITQGVLLDITPQKEAEDRLRQSEAQYRSLVENLPGLVYLTRLDDVITPIYVSPQVGDLHARDYDQWLANARQWVDHVHEDDRQRVLDLKRQIVATLAPTVSEHRVVDASGQLRWVRDQMTIVRDASGQPLFIQGIVFDITEERTVAEALRASRHILQFVMDHIPQRVFWKDAGSVYLGCNRAFAMDAEVDDPPAIVGKTDFDLPWPDQAELYRHDDHQVIEHGEPRLGYEEPQGARWLRTSKVPLRDSSNAIIGVLGTYEDITERKQAEERIRRSEARLSAIINSTNVGIVLVDPQGRYVFVNDQWATMLGYTRDELIGRDYLEITHADDYTVSDWNFSRLAAGVIPHYQIEKRYMRRDGSTFWGQLSASSTLDADNQPDQIIGVIVDISERVQIEAAEREQRTLAEALRRTANVLNSSLELDTVLDHILESVGQVVPHDAANIMFVDETGEQLIAVASQGYERFGMEAWLQQRRFPIGTILASGDDRTTYVVGDTRTSPAWVDLDETRWIRSYMAAKICLGERALGIINLDSETPDFFQPEHAERLGVFADQAAIAITNARLVESLRRSEEKARSIIEQSHDGIRLIDAQGIIREWNQGCERITGIARERALGQHLLDVVRELAPPGAAGAAGLASVAAMLDEMRDAAPKHRAWSLDDSIRQDATIQRADGTQRTVQTTTFPIMAGNERMWCTISRDITDQLAAEQGRLRLAMEREKVTLLERFLGNVSHDFKSPLTALKVSLDVIERSADDAERRQRHLAIIRLQSQRLQKLLEDLLFMTRLDKDLNLGRVRTNLNRLVSDVLTSHRSAFQANQLTLDLQLAGEPLYVAVDQKRFGRVVEALVENAVNYTPPGGTVTVLTGAREDEALVEIRDTGTGIDADSLQRVFEHFYREDEARTPSEKGGMGLGLTIAKKIVDAHQGRIEVASTPGAGSTFRVLLPLQPVPEHG